MKPNILAILFLSSSIIFSQISFDADFESGNLKSVTQIDSTTFNVETYEDIGGRWFYFKIAGVKDKQITVNVITSPHDFTKAMYSYDDKTFLRFSDSESPQVGTFSKLFEEDTVFVSYYTPYTFAYLQERIDEWKENGFVKVDTIGFTSNDLPIQELHITNHAISSKNKRTVWIHARTHPGETPSSWHFDGIVQELLSGDETIDFYLDSLDFYLIPFVNPDGVYYGRSRTNFNYIDVESNWNETESNTSEEVKILRERMIELNNEKPFSVALNLHSQASSYCTFWIHTASSTSEYFYLREYQFSNLQTSDNNYFEKYEDYSESNLRPVYPEGWLWDNYGEQVMALTYETPYNNYFRNNPDTLIEVTNENLFAIGRRTIYAIAEYLELSTDSYYLMDNKIATVEGFSNNYSVGNDFYSDDFLAMDSNSEAKAIFETEELPAGHYDLSGWWITNDVNSYETEIIVTTGNSIDTLVKNQKLNGAQWNYLTEVVLENNGKIKIEMPSNSTGFVIADAFRLIRTQIITSVKENALSNNFELYQNYPNPFNPTTTIKYRIGEQYKSNNVKLEIFDILGRRVTTLVNKYQQSGIYEVNFNANNFASGNYFYRLQVGNFVETKKMVLVK